METNQTKTNQRNAVREVAIAIAGAIKELGSVPSGHLYARLMDQMSLATYEKIVGALIGAGLVRKEPSHLLVWIGPR